MGQKFLIVNSCIREKWYLQVICTQTQTDLLALVDVDPQNAHWADAYFALWRHLAQFPHLPFVRVHDLDNARIRC